MARKCAVNECSNFIPRIFIDSNGKHHNFQRRKFCLECSPFGEHNTKKIDKNYGQKICQVCGDLCQNNRSKCNKCFFAEKKKRRCEKVYNIVGNKCWICGYDKTTASLDFHHIDPSKKKMELSVREFVGIKWSTIIEEMQKCVLLCSNCHREYHSKLISDEKINKIFNQNWDSIKGDLCEWLKQQSS